MVAGVRRMAACLIIKQVEALGLCSNFQMDDEVKPVVTCIGMRAGNPLATSYLAF